MNAVSFTADGYVIALASLSLCWSADLSMLYLMSQLSWPAQVGSLKRTCALRSTGQPAQQVLLSATQLVHIEMKCLS